MASQPNIGTAALRDMLIPGRPQFEAALEKERQVELFCQQIRSDLKARRERIGLDQAVLAKKLEIGQSAVSRLENGRGDIGMKTLYRYADALGMTPVVIFVPSKERIAEEIMGVIRPDDAGALRENAVGAALKAQEMLLRGMSDAIPAVAAKIASAA